MTGDFLETAFRAYIEPAAPEGHELPRRIRRDLVRHQPKYAVIFDTETTIDPTQALTFGCYRYVRLGWRGRNVAASTVEEGLVYADELPTSDPEGFEMLRQYARTHRPDIDLRAKNPCRDLRLLSRTEFVEQILWRSWFKLPRALIVGFNLPFDLSRLAIDVGHARSTDFGGFSLKLWDGYTDSHGVAREGGVRPRIAIKTIDSKRALKRFTRLKKYDWIDQIPEHSPTGRADPSYGFRGHFLDLRTLAFALTDRSYTLDAACEAFAVEHPKLQVVAHGVITPDYIEYNRRDVEATTELLEKLLIEYWRHPISLQPTKAYSPASLAKSCLRDMNIEPIRARQPEFQKEAPRCFKWVVPSRACRR